ncbi:hypothetical protein [Desulfobulbus sp.]|nr:hypothetical protein [Desulfobulbus sp.]
MVLRGKTPGLVHQELPSESFAHFPEHLDRDALRYLRKSSETTLATIRAA